MNSNQVLVEKCLEKFLDIARRREKILQLFLAIEELLVPGLPVGLEYGFEFREFCIQVSCRGLVVYWAGEEVKARGLGDPDLLFLGSLVEGFLKGLLEVAENLEQSYIDFERQSLQDIPDDGEF